MKKRQNPRTKSALILTFCLLFYWTTIGNTGDAIQLRKYPASDGLVLDTLPKGQKVKIVETFGSWRYIVVEGSTYGGGWVHFEDLEKGPATDQKADVSPELSKAEVRKEPEAKKTDNAIKKPTLQSQKTAEDKNNPKPSFHSKVSVGTVKIHPVDDPKEAGKAEPDSGIKKKPGLKKDPPDRPIKSGNKDIKGDLQQVQTEVEKSVQPPHNMKPAPQLPPQAEPAGPKENFHTPEKNASMSLIKTAYADSIPKTTVPSGKVPNDTTQVIEISSGMAKGPERPNAATEADNTQNFQHKEKATYQGGMRDFLNFGFRLLSVALSCLAIIFAYKAKKMAAMSYHLVVQLQQGIEIHRRREIDERY